MDPAALEADDDTSRAAAVRASVDRAPTLTPEQVATLGVLFAPAVERHTAPGDAS